MKKFGLIVALALGLGCSLVGAKEQFNKAKAESLNCQNPCLVDTITGSSLVREGYTNFFTTPDNDSLNSRYQIYSYTIDDIKSDSFTVRASRTEMDPESFGETYAFYSFTRDIGIIDKVKFEINTSGSYTTSTAIIEVYGRGTPYGGSTDFYDSSRIGMLIDSCAISEFDANKSFEMKIDGNFKGFGIKIVGTNAKVAFTAITATWVNAECEDIDIGMEDDPEQIIHTTWGNTYTLSSSNNRVFKIEDNKVLPISGGYAYIVITVDGHEFYYDVVVEENGTIPTYTKKATNSNRTGSDATGWEVVTDISQLKSGELIVFGHIDDEKSTIHIPTNVISNQFFWFLGSEQVVTETDGLYTFVNNQPLPMMAVKSENGEWQFYFKNGDNQYEMGVSLDPTSYGLHLVASPENTNFTITIEGGNAIIKSVNYDSFTMQFDTSDSTSGFTENEYDTVQLLHYVGTSNETFIIDDTIDGYSPALYFAHQFLNCFDGVCHLEGGATQKEVEDAIAEIFGSDLFEGLNETSLEMLKCVNADSTGNALAQAASLYDYLVERFGIEDTLDRGIIPANPNSIKLSDTEASTISIAIIMSAMTLIGPSLLFLKKKKFVK